MNKSEKMNQRICFALLSVAVCILMGACASSKESISRGKLIIREQGSFAVGGAVIARPGTFDPIAHGAYNPTNQPSEGQTLHGDHAYVFYQMPDKAPPTSISILARAWAVGKDVGNYSRRQRRFSKYFPSPSLSRLPD